MNDTVDVMVNGEPRAVARGATLLELLESLALDPRAVVVKHNRTIVRRPALGAVTVAPGTASPSGSRSRTSVSGCAISSIVDPQGCSSTAPISIVPCMGHIDPRARAARKTYGWSMNCRSKERVKTQDWSVLHV